MSTEDIWIGEYVLDERGNPVPEHDVLVWAQWFETHDRHVALTAFTWGCVSTVFLGLDNSFDLNPMKDPLAYKPVLWETITFGGTLNRQQRRYRSREEAVNGHYLMVKECKAAQKRFIDQMGWEVKPWVRAVWKRLCKRDLPQERAKKSKNWWMPKSIRSALRKLAAIRSK